MEFEHDSFDNIFDEISQYGLEQVNPINLINPDNLNSIGPMLQIYTHINTNKICKIEYGKSLKELKLNLFSSNNKLALKLYFVNSNFNSEILFNILLNFIKNLNLDFSEQNMTKNCICVTCNIFANSIQLYFAPYDQNSLSSIKKNHYIYTNNFEEFEMWFNLPTPQIKYIAIPIFIKN